MPQASTTVPNLSLLAAVVHCDESGGALGILVPTYQAALESLFHKPIRDDKGQVFAPWTPQALQFIWDIGLARSGFAALEVPP